MSQSERHHRIVSMLREHRVVPKAEFLARLEISPATLKRDLEYFRSHLHTPIGWSRADDDGRGLKHSMISIPPCQKICRDLLLYDDSNIYLTASPPVQCRTIDGTLHHFP